MSIANSGNSQQVDFSKIETIEHQVDDVMELINSTELKIKLIEVEYQYKENPTELNKTSLGIVWLSKTKTFFSVSAVFFFAERYQSSWAL